MPKNVFPYFFQYHWNEKKGTDGFSGITELHDIFLIISWYQWSFNLRKYLQGNEWTTRNTFFFVFLSFDCRWKLLTVPICPASSSGNWSPPLCGTPCGTSGRSPGIRSPACPTVSRSSGCRYHTEFHWNEKKRRKQIECNKVLNTSSMKPMKRHGKILKALAPHILTIRALT